MSILVKHCKRMFYERKSFVGLVLIYILWLVLEMNNAIRLWPAILNMP